MNPQPIIRVTDASNQQFLETHAGPGRVGLAGGIAFIDRVIRRAERHVDANACWSLWSHAFLFQGPRVDGHHWVVESDLQAHRKHISLGAQENRITKYFDEKVYTCLAILDFGLTPAQEKAIVTESLDMVAGRSRYSIRELVGTLFALRHPGLREKENILAREQSFYCSAFVGHLFRRIGVDLAPGLNAKNTTPEHIARTEVPHTMYLLDRPEPARPIARARQRLADLRTRLKNKSPGASEPPPPR